MSVRHINENEFNTEVLGSDEKILVDFYADWCGPCKMLSPIMEDISNETKVFKVNVDEEENLAVKYGIMSIPCVILFENGKEVKRIIGLRPKQDILDMLK